MCVINYELRVSYLVSEIFGHLLVDPMFSEAREHSMRFGRGARASHASFSLRCSQADEKLWSCESLSPPPKKRFWAVKHLVGQLAW